MTRLVYGVGLNDGKYPATFQRQNTKEYQLWLSMLCRCYCPKTQIRQPSYVGCTVSDNFKNFTFFHEWLQTQIGFGCLNYVLDKDLLVKGNKIYSETTCVLVPYVLNSLFITCARSRGVYPVGVNKSGKFFRSRLNTLDKRKTLGFFGTPQEAFQAYKIAKESHIKLQAEKYKNLIDIRVYEALISYQVEITD